MFYLFAPLQLGLNPITSVGAMKLLTVIKDHKESAMTELELQVRVMD